MKALMPGEPFSERPDRSTASGDLPPVVEVLSAEKVFANGTRGLAPIDLSIADGEFLTLIGPSGCGKSTLLKLIANLIEPSDGRLLWWRGEFAQVGQEGRRFAFVFQEPTLMPWARVDANVRLPLELADVAGAKAAPAVAEAIERVGLSKFARYFPRQLSGGMKMRVSIARALAARPKLLLMDEPFAALEEITRAGLNDDLLALAREDGITVIFVTHSVMESAYLSSRVLVMSPRPGRITADIALSPGPHDRLSREFAQAQARVASALLEAA